MGNVTFYKVGAILGVCLLINFILKKKRHIKEIWVYKKETGVEEEEIEEVFATAFISWKNSSGEAVDSRSFEGNR